MTFHDPADAQAAATRLAALRGQVLALTDLTVEVDTVGGDSHAHLALVTTHQDLAGLRAYADDPAHQEVLAWLRPRLAARLVVDAET